MEKSNLLNVFKARTYKEMDVIDSVTIKSWLFMHELLQTIGTIHKA